MADLRRALVPLAGLAILGAAPVSRAQDAAIAEALFREGRQLLEQGNVAAACLKFAESQRQDPTSGTLLNLASCHAREGKTASAWADFLAAARLAQREGKQARVDEANKQAAELEKKLSRLTIQVAARVPGLEIRRDDVVIGEGAWGTKVPVDPGPHVITATAAGYAKVTQSVTVGAERDDQTVEIPPLERSAEPPSASAAPPSSPASGPPPASAPPPLADTSTSSPSPGRSPALGYVVGGAGVLLTGVGAVVGVMALGAYGDAKDACPTKTGCSQAAIDDRDRAGTLANVANVGIGVGVVAIGVGAYLVLTSGSSGQTGRGGRSDRSSAWVTPALGPGMVGTSLGGRF